MVHEAESRIAYNSSSTVLYFLGVSMNLPISFQFLSKTMFVGSFPTLHCVLGPFDLYCVDVVEGVPPDSERHHNLLTRWSKISRSGLEIRWRLLSPRSCSLGP